MTPREKLDQALRDGSGIPAGPAVIARIEELTRNPDATAKDLADVLQLDPTLTTRVLKQVNSPFYGMSSQIKTVTHAVVILGFQEVKNIALTVPVANLYKKKEGQQGIDVEALWSQTVALACLARALSYHVQHPVPEQVFVCGILSKTGMVVLNWILQGDYASVVEQCPDEDFLLQIERSELGITHVEVGTLLAEKWKFPQDLRDAITYQYSPYRPAETTGQGEEEETDTVEQAVIPEAGLIFAARRTLRGINDELTPEDILLTLPPPIVQTFNLDAEALGTAIDKAAEAFEAAHTMLSG